MTWVLPFPEASGIQNECDGSSFEILQLLVLSKMQNCTGGVRGKRQNLYFFFSCICKRRVDLWKKKCKNGTELMRKVNVLCKSSNHCPFKGEKMKRSDLVLSPW